MNPTVPAARHPAFPALLTVAAALFVLFLRRPGVFLEPQLWAEDGQIFFVQADTLGWRALVSPYGGYHLLWERLLAAAAAPLDPLWIPAVYFWASLAAVAGVVLALFSPRLDLPHRSSLALALVLVPHTGEIFHNLTNAQWITALGLVLLLLARDAHSARSWTADIAVTVFVGLTGVFSLLFAPLFVLRAWLRRTRAAWILAGLMLAVAAVQAQALLHTSPPAVGGDDTVFNLLRTAGHRLCAALLLPPSLADKVWPWLLAGGGTIALAVLAWAGLRQTARRETRLLLWGCVAAVFVGTACKFWGQLIVFSGLGNGDRYFVLPKILLLWLLILEWDAPTRWRWLARALCGAALVASLSAFRFAPYKDCDWPAWAARLRAGERVVVPINPEGMTFTHPGRPAR